MNKRTEYENAKFQALHRINTIIDAAKRVKKNINRGQSVGLGEGLQNTWELYFYLGQLHKLRQDLEKEEKHESA